MEETFKIWETSRNAYLRYLDSFSLEQLNTIPAGFSNNIIWNIGHAIVVQQSLVYRLSGLPMNISEELFETYKSGSFPTGKTTQEEVDELRHLLISLQAQTKIDFEAGNFVSYKEFSTKTGFQLANVKEAMAFNNFHEGTHYGIIMQLKKFV